MKKTLFVAATTLILSAAGAFAQILQTAFNFNDGQASGSTANTTTFTSTGGLQASTITNNFTVTAPVVFAGTTVNAVSGDAAGNALTAQGGTGATTGGTGGNNGSYIEFTLNSTALTNLALSFAAQRTTTGFTTVTLAYGLAGDTGAFTTFGIAGTGGTAIGASFATTGVLSYALPTAAENQAALTIRATFTGASATAGNVRLDNVQVNSGVTGAVPEPSTYAYLAGGLGLLTLGMRRRGIA